MGLRESQISIVIATYGRSQVLVDTISLLLQFAVCAREIIVIDQNPELPGPIEKRLANWHASGKIHRVKQFPPSIVNAMNSGLMLARGDVVLFSDDDIIPASELVQSHAAAHRIHPEAIAVVGQVLQPGEAAVSKAQTGSRVGLYADLDFKFNSRDKTHIFNIIGCNVSVKRQQSIELGGFDLNYLGVAYRFETDFARRITAAGGKIWFEPKASIRHLRAPSGGTRMFGDHLTSASPMHGVGDYYFALRHGQGWEKWWYILRRPFREVRTKFHLKHPWFIPVKIIGELRAMVLAFKLYRQGPKLLKKERAQTDNRELRTAN